MAAQVYRTVTPPLAVGERVEVLGYPPGHTKGSVYARVAVPDEQGETFAVELDEWLCFGVGVPPTPVTFRLIVAHVSSLVREGA